MTVGPASKIFKLSLKIKEYILDTLFPAECISCRREGEWFCEDCLGKIKLEKFSFSDGSLSKIFTFYSYDNDLIKKAIHLLKYKFIENLSIPLGDILAKNIINEVNNELSGEFILIPVPLHKKRLTERGFNQAELLAERVSLKFNWSVEKSAIARIINTKPQVGLEEEERIKNTKGAFKITDLSKIKNKKIIIIDDVVTTGSTMKECSRILKINGAREIFGVGLAKG